MIEIVLTREEYVNFTAEAKKRMRIKGWSAKVLAKKIGRPVESVYMFFSPNNKPSRFLAAEIANALEMEQKDWQ